MCIILTLQIMKIGLEEFIHWFEFNIKSLLTSKCKVPPHMGKQIKTRNLGWLELHVHKGKQTKKMFFQTKQPVLKCVETSDLKFLGSQLCSKQPSHLTNNFQISTGL